MAPGKDPEFSSNSVATSKELRDVYADIAKRRGTAFLAASDYVTASTIDDEHMDEDGHKVFADVIYRKLEKIIA